MLIERCSAEEKLWDFSLFFEEEVEITEEKSVLELQGISYLNEEDWVVWINNKRYSKKENFEGVKIQKINLAEIELIWIIEGYRHFIKLSPGEVYCSKNRITFQSRSQCLCD